MTKQQHNPEPEQQPEREHPQEQREEKPQGYTGNPFKPEWRSALDDPEHPLHHLRDA